MLSWIPNRELLLMATQMHAPSKSNTDFTPEQHVSVGRSDEAPALMYVTQSIMLYMTSSHEALGAGAGAGTGMSEEETSWLEMTARMAKMQNNPDDLPILSRQIQGLTVKWR